MKTYGASWDNLVKGLTIFIILLFLAGITLISLLVANGELSGNKMILPWVGVLFMILTLLVAYVLRPVGYRVGISKIIIDRPLGAIEISKKDVQRIQVLDRSAMGIMIRSFGNGGLFGYVGKFYSKPLGHYTAYVTNRNNLVLVKLKSGKKYLISPDQTDWVENWLNGESY